jgi:hypothetical protein
VTKLTERSSFFGGVFSSRKLPHSKLYFAVCIFFTKQIQPLFIGLVFFFYHQWSFHASPQISLELLSDQSFCMSPGNRVKVSSVTTLTFNPVSTISHHLHLTIQQHIIVSSCAMCHLMPRYLSNDKIFKL